MSNRLIDIVDITKSYGDSVILDQLNLYIRENEFLTLLGPGKCSHCIASQVRENNTAENFRWF